MPLRLVANIAPSVFKLPSVFFKLTVVFQSSEKRAQTSLQFLCCSVYRFFESACKISDSDWIVPSWSGFHEAPFVLSAKFFAIYIT